MITALDSNILIDVLGNDPLFAQPSKNALTQARFSGRLIVCPIVAAEISAGFSTPEALHERLDRMQIELIDFSIEDAHRAGVAFVNYRRNSRQPKNRMIADFLIGAHALHRADVLLTRDRGYYRVYYPDLRLTNPEPAI